MIDDYITKQAALDCFHDWIDRYGHYHEACEITEYNAIEALPEADVVPWSVLERYADYFCAIVPYPEFIREAKMFYLDSIGAMEGGNIDG